MSNCGRFCWYSVPTLSLPAKSNPVLMDHWIKHLSFKAEIPNYQLVNGYHYIKLCAYQYYVKELADIKEDISQEEKERAIRLRELFQ